MKQLSFDTNSVLSHTVVVIPHSRRPAASSFAATAVADNTEFLFNAPSYEQKVAPIEWRINAVNYQKLTNSVFNVPAATNGYNRIDLLYATTSNTVLRLQGTETTGIAVAPVLPVNTISVALLYISGSVIQPPFPDLSGYLTRPMGDMYYIQASPASQQNAFININAGGSPITFNGRNYGTVLVDAPLASSVTMRNNGNEYGYFGSSVVDGADVNDFGVRAVGTLWLQAAANTRVKSRSEIEAPAFSTTGYNAGFNGAIYGRYYSDIYQGGSVIGGLSSSNNAFDVAPATNQYVIRSNTGDMLFATYSVNHNTATFAKFANGYFHLVKTPNTDTTPTQVITRDATTGELKLAPYSGGGGGGGSVTNVSSANSDISVATATTTPVLTLNSGNGANQIVKRDVSGNIAGYQQTLPTGTDAQVLGYSSGTPTPVTLGLTQLSDIGSIPAFSNGVYTFTGINPTTGSALRAFIEFSTTTPKAGTFPTYGTGGVLPVNNGVASTDAVNVSQLAGYVPTSRTLTGGNGINTIGDLSANRTISVDTTTIMPKANSLTLAQIQTRFGSGNFFPQPAVFTGGGTSTSDYFNVIGATGVSGTGNILMSGSPTMVTPTLGAATATSINKVTITAPTTNATLTLVQGSSLITAGAFSNTITTTANTTVTFPTTGTLYGTATGSITSAQLLASLSNETGTGVAVFGTAPTLSNPVVGTQTAGNSSTLAASTAFVQNALNARAISTKTTTYSVLATDYTILGDATTASFTITLPTASTVTGQVFNFKKIDASANTVTIAGTIDGVTNKIISTQYNGFSVQSNGTAYFILL